ncbi:MAG: SH3 domain-containing protein [Chloroflexi bacterium]|nr:SH3 domain-containing protein [Chloroflexota bacterium]
MVKHTNIRKWLIFLAAMTLLALAPTAALAQLATPIVVVNTYRLNVRSGPGAGHAILTTVAGGTELPVTMLSDDRKWYQVTSSVGPGWLHSAYAVPRGDFSRVPRQGLPTNLASGTNIPAGAPHVVVNTAYLNIRTGPGVGHTILTTVKGGTALAVTAIDSGGVWYQVETSAGAGWLNRSYTVARGSFAGVPREGIPAGGDLAGGTNFPAGSPHLVVNTAFLNVRTGPGAGHSILTVVKGGTNLLVTEIDSGGVWYKVETSAGPGWVNSNYTVGRGNFSSISRSGAGSSGPREGAHLSGPTPRAVVNTAHLNIRTGPSAGHTIITDVPGGTTLEILGMSSGRNWYKVQGSFGQGWLNNNYVVFRGDFSQVRVVS